ncbi:hypothetical protein ACWDSJ_06345 [Nocardia sp. NPDC003482]
MTASPAAWRVDDGAAVSFRDATVAWALAAHGVLVETAKGYGHFVTINDLGAQVQEMSGVRTGAPTRTWVDAVLRKVARRCHAAGEPPLTALCVRPNHTVTDSYRYVLELAGLPVPEDIELHAAYARWQCYAAHGTDVPVGVPPLTPKVAAKRGLSVERVEPKAEPARARMCGECFVQLPASGICGFCNPSR